MCSSDLLCPLSVDVKKAVFRQKASYHIACFSAFHSGGPVNIREDSWVAGRGRLATELSLGDAGSLATEHMGQGGEGVSRLSRSLACKEGLRSVSF